MLNKKSALKTLLAIATLFMTSCSSERSIKDYAALYSSLDEGEILKEVDYLLENNSGTYILEGFPDEISKLGPVSLYIWPDYVEITLRVHGLKKKGSILVYPDKLPPRNGDEIDYLVRISNNAQYCIRSN